MKKLKDITLMEFTAMASLFNIDVQYLTSPMNKFNHRTYVFHLDVDDNKYDTRHLVGDYYVPDAKSLHIFFENHRDSYLGILLNQDTLFWHYNVLRSCNIPKTNDHKRAKIYEAIDEERNYQDLKWNTGLRTDKVPDEDKSVAEWLNYIEYHLVLAKNNVYQLDKTAALAEMRKISALAVRCMEIHGCPEREPILKTNTHSEYYKAHVLKRGM